MCCFTGWDEGHHESVAGAESLTHTHTHKHLCYTFNDYKQMQKKERHTQTLEPLRETLAHFVLSSLIILIAADVR